MLGNISIWQLVIVLAIVVLLFGTKRLRTLGGDLGGALKSFKKAVNEHDLTADGQDTLKQTETQFNTESKPVAITEPAHNK